jgi:hypothetical protein
MIVIHQFLFDQIIAPRIIGKQVGLHPLLAITAMLVGGTLMGIAGTLVAVPLAACAQVVIMHLYPRLSDDTVSELSERYAAESDEKAEIEKKANRAAISGKQSASRRRRIAQHLAEQIAEREQKQPADGPSTT